MDIQKRDNETQSEYMKRLTNGILVDKTISTTEYENLSEPLFGEGNNYNSSEVRKRCYGIKAYIEALEKDEVNNISDDKILKEYELKRIEVEKGTQKFFDQRTSYKKLVRDNTREDENYDIIKRIMSEGNLPKLEYVYKTIEHTDNDLLVSLNDIHFGADISNAWNTYNSDIFKTRLTEYINQILEVKNLHNSENCYVCANGDLISGIIHPSILASNKENIIEQIMGVSECISQFLGELSKHFNNVVFTVVAGNHSRLGNKDDSLKNERMDYLVPWYAKARLQNVDNISFTKNIDSTMSIIDIRNKKYLQIHGDYDSGKSAKQACALMAGKDIYAICCGHLHHSSMDYVDGTKIIMAGSFLGMDDYCISKRIIGIPQQLICVCDVSGVKCLYDINF